MVIEISARVTVAFVSASEAEIPAAWVSPSVRPPIYEGSFLIV